MLRSIVQTTLLRELAAMRRTVKAYPSDESIWAQRPGLPNAGGTLVLHVAGNLQHYLGAVLGGSGYRRDRDAEFARRDVPRAMLLGELAAATAAVELTMPQIPAEALAQPYPEPIGGHVIPTGAFLVHLATHLAYHLGQLDYHRRVVTGSSEGVGALKAGLLSGTRELFD